MEVRAFPCWYPLTLCPIVSVFLTLCLSPVPSCSFPISFLSLYYFYLNFSTRQPPETVSDKSPQIFDWPFFFFFYSMRTHDVYSELFLSNYTQSLLVNNLIPFSFVLKKTIACAPIISLLDSLYQTTPTPCEWISSFLPCSLKKKIYSIRTHDVCPRRLRFFVSNNTRSLWVNKLIPFSFA